MIQQKHLILKKYVIGFLTACLRSLPQIPCYKIDMELSGKVSFKGALSRKVDHSGKLQRKLLGKAIISTLN